MPKVIHVTDIGKFDLARYERLLKACYNAMAVGDFPIFYFENIKMHSRFAYYLLEYLAANLEE